MISPVESGVTVLICSHNGKHNLPNTLKSIASQMVEPDLRWEVVFVDNASTDNTSQQARECWDRYKLPISFRVVTEPRRGKENAITLGLSLALYSYVIICDDDNWLNEDYVQLAFDIMSQHEYIGLLGGQGIPMFGGEKPDWFSTYERCYAVGKQNEVDGEVKPTLEMRFIWGAGSVINKKAYNLLLNAGFTRLITQERYPSISRCEDLEMSLAIQLTGYKLWYDSRLVFRHFIAKEKLTWSYLIDVAKPGAMVRPYLLLYNALRVLNFDTKENNRYSAYRKMWTEYKRNYVNTMIRSNLNLSGIIYSIRLLFGWHAEGDSTYFAKMNKWYFFLGAMRLREKEFEEIFLRLVKVKNKIAPNY